MLGDFCRATREALAAEERASLRLLLRTGDENGEDRNEEGDMTEVAT